MRKNIFEIGVTYFSNTANKCAWVFGIINIIRKNTVVTFYNKLLYDSVIFLNFFYSNKHFCHLSFCV